MSKTDISLRRLEMRFKYQSVVSLTDYFIFYLETKKYYNVQTIML